MSNRICDFQAFSYMLYFVNIGHVNEYLTMQFFTGTSRITLSQGHKYAITDWVVWDSQYLPFWELYNLSGVRILAIVSISEPGCIES